MSIFIIGLPRSGTSLISNLLYDSGIRSIKDEAIQKLKSYELNQGGYFENTLFNLLNDQLIRIVYGNKYSFLHINHLRKKLIANTNFTNYDIDEKTLFIPDDYYSNLEKYCGREWDNWGLSRMIKDQKWFKCYSKNKISNLNGILKLKKRFENIFVKKKSFFIKDPRLSLLLGHYYLGKKPKIIIMKRNKYSILKSMRNHYGEYLFKKKMIKNTNFCSNHFNYKIRYQSYDEYFFSFNKLIYDSLKKKKYEFIEVKFEDLLNKNVKMLEYFLNININLNAIKN